MADRLRAAAERALDALNDLIRNTFDPGSEALGARYELAHALTAPAARQTTGQDGIELGSRPTAPVTLATPCDNCDHVLNWHGNQAACIFAFCGCGRFRAPEPAVGQQAEARTTDEARPPREQWRVEIYDPVAEEWAPGVAFSERDRAAERLDAVPTYSPRWGTDTPPRRRLVRETTTWTVENEDR
ncbi:hypothetical protein MIU24_35500 [Streptomyces venezuelae]|uniref:hypothetical protein n=1 Tax=Streptomyces sp. B6(2022) TaxID=3404749 RepID=UPI00311E3A4F